MSKIEYIIYEISDYFDKFIETRWGKLLLRTTIAIALIMFIFRDTYTRLTVKPEGDCSNVPISYYHNKEGDTLKYCHQREDGTIGLRYGEPYTDTWETFDLEQWAEGEAIAAAVEAPVY